VAAEETYHRDVERIFGRGIICSTTVMPMVFGFQGIMSSRVNPMQEAELPNGDGQVGAVGSGAAFAGRRKMFLLLTPH